MLEFSIELDKPRIEAIIKELREIKLRLNDLTEQEKILRDELSILVAPLGTGQKYCSTELDGVTVANTPATTQINYNRHLVDELLVRVKEELGLSHWIAKELEIARVESGKAGTIRVVFPK